MDNLNFDRLIHLDFKGAPPKISFFEEFFPFLKNLGATGLLLEWEDTFPYSKELLEIGSINSTDEAHYSLDDILRILELAQQSTLSVIPLVQTFGHMEFILKHYQWRHLREVEDYPSSICPSHTETLPLIRNLIDQIVSLHPDIQYIHIGGDEVWHMGRCPACQERIQHSKFGKSSLYMDHITEIAQYINSSYSHIKIIIWDDMFRNITESILEEYEIGKLVEPMIWHYDTSNNFFNNTNLWDKYTNIFPNIWAASAFKGATSSCQIIPVTNYHIENQECWLRGLNVHQEKIRQFRGVALTGWSRYDHYATLCELLPCGIPSLCFCLRTWLDGRFSSELNEVVGKMLGYQNEFPTSNLSVRKIPSSEKLTFPGWRVFIGMEWLAHFKNKYRNTVNGDQIQTWLNAWQTANNYTNPMQLDCILPLIKSLKDELLLLEENLNVNLHDIFFNHTVDELMGSILLPMKEHLIKLEYDCLLQKSKGCRAKPHQKQNI